MCIRDRWYGYSMRTICKLISNKTSPLLMTRCLPGHIVQDAWRKRWFAKGAQQITIDKLMKEKYESLLHKCAKSSFLSTTSSRWEIVAMIILFDQIPRNIYRGSPRAYEYDNIARHLVQPFMHTMTRNPSFTLAFQFECTLQITLCHSENFRDHDIVADRIRSVHFKTYTITNQELCLALHAIHNNHAERIRLFGRFPERNSVLLRKNTSAELAFLGALYLWNYGLWPNFFWVWVLNACIYYAV